MPDSSPTYRIGYCTSGLKNHRLGEALHLIADMGYRGAFLTLEVGHLDPRSPGIQKEIATTAQLIKDRDLEVVVETGARFLLDPRHKHWPVLLSPDPSPRIRFLEQAIEIASQLGSKVVSFWSGVNASDLAPRKALAVLAKRIAPLLEHASDHSVTMALEPEPGMFIETVDQYHELRGALDDPDALKLSLDCGHLLVTGEGEPADVLRREVDHLACIAIEDMRRGVHEHLPFGEGDLDLASLVAALNDLDFSGVVAVELGRHSHEGPMQLKAAKEVLSSHGVPFGPSP